jgi:hypothetical protein
VSILRLETGDGRTAFRPGDTIEGRAEWTLDSPPESLALRLFWYTQGKGTVDAGIVDTVRLENPSRSGERSFSFVLPDSPYTFSGRLISLLWAVEIVVLPSKEVHRLNFVLSPTGEEIDLTKGSGHDSP